MLRRERDVRELGRAVEQRLLAVGDDDLRVGEYLGVLQLLERAHRQAEIISRKLTGEHAGVAPGHVGDIRTVGKAGRTCNLPRHKIVLRAVVTGRPAAGKVSIGHGRISFTGRRGGRNPVFGRIIGVRVTVLVFVQPPIAVFHAAIQILDGRAPAFKLVPLDAQLVHRLVGKLDEAGFDVDLRHGLVHGPDDRFAVGQDAIRGCHNNGVRAGERRRDPLDKLACLVLEAVAVVEELGEFLYRSMVQLERPRKDGIDKLVLLHEMDAARRFHAEAARVEDRPHRLQPRHMLERNGHVLLEVGGFRIDDVRARGLAELAQDVRERGVVGHDIHERRLVGGQELGRDVRTRRLSRSYALRGDRFLNRARCDRQGFGGGGFRIRRSELDDRAAFCRNSGIIRLFKVDLVRFAFGWLLCFSRFHSFNWLFLHRLSRFGWLFLHRLSRFGWFFLRRLCRFDRLGLFRFCRLGLLRQSQIAEQRFSGGRRRLRFLGERRQRQCYAHSERRCFQCVDVHLPPPVFFCSVFVGCSASRACTRLSLSFLSLPSSPCMRQVKRMPSCVKDIRSPST